MNNAEKLAKAHVEWEKRAIMRMYHEFDFHMMEITNQHREFMERVTNCMFKLVEENFIHGYKHGKEAKE